MNIYVETNFILEIALTQEQHGACESILRLCEEKRGQLLIPAFSMAESHQALVRRHKRRRKLTDDLEWELKQLARNRNDSERLNHSHRVIEYPETQGGQRPPVRAGRRPAASGGRLERHGNLQGEIQPVAAPAQPGMRLLWPQAAPVPAPYAVIAKLRLSASDASCQPIAAIQPLSHRG